VVHGAADEHFVALCRELPSASQKRAWTNQLALLKRALAAVPAAEEWFIVFEYELPFEGGRRPDVVLLAGETVFVLEFKDALVLGRLTTTRPRLTRATFLSITRLRTGAQFVLSSLQRTHELSRHGTE
jgi:hypothetical protein